METSVFVRGNMTVLGAHSNPAAILPRSMGDVRPHRMSRVEELERQIEMFMARMRIAVVFGGDKRAQGSVIYRTANPRPWKSYEKVANDIADALRRLGFRHVSIMPEDMRLGESLQRDGIDFVWLNTGGVQGFGAVSHAPAMLEMLGVPYVGHNPLNAGALDNKHLFKRDMISLGIPTAPFMIWHPARGPLNPADNSRFAQAFAGYEGAFIVKPVSGRASHHVTVVDRLADLDACVAEIGETTGNLVLIESYLSGREFCVAVCGRIRAREARLERLEEPFVFSMVERALDRDERIFTSMDQRPITVDRVRALDLEADALIRRDLEVMARSVFTELDLETLVRLDVRADANGRLHVLEANPKPDLAAPHAGKTSLVCSGLANEGMSYDDLILSLLADRVDTLFRERRGTVGHLQALLG